MTANHRKRLEMKFAWRSLGESNRCFSLERAVTGHFLCRRLRSLCASIQEYWRNWREFGSGISPLAPGQSLSPTRQAHQEKGIASSCRSWKGLVSAVTPNVTVPGDPPLHLSL